MAIDHPANTVLAYAPDKHKNIIFKQLKKLFEPFGISRYYTNDWGSFDRCLEADKRKVAKVIHKKLNEKN